MPYITTDYYLNEYGGTPATETQNLNKLVREASDNVEILIGSKVRQDNIEASHEAIRGQIKKATAKLVEHYIENKVFDTDDDGDIYSSVGIGSFNYSVSKDNQKEKPAKDYIPDSIVNILIPTGLFYSGLTVVDGSGY